MYYGKWLLFSRLFYKTLGYIPPDKFIRCVRSLIGNLRVPDSITGVGDDTQE